MDYIQKQLERRILFLETTGKESEMRIYYQVRIEYCMFLILGYLWNKNLSKLTPGDREYIFAKIFKPTIGDIEDIGRKLDIDKEIFGNGKISLALKKYPKIRNEKIGHGYVFEDATSEYLNSLRDLYLTICATSSPLLNSNVNYVAVKSEANNYYKGISFKFNGADYAAWSCPLSLQSFEVGSTYVSIGINKYYRVSPFIEIVDESEFYLYCSVIEPLNGTVKYNQLLKTAILTRDWPELCELDVENDGSKRKSKNGTILNVIEGNKGPKYIDTGIKQRVLDFLLKTNHSVSATLWGHGGVGKTAVIRSVCDDLSLLDRKQFDYIIFLSAKDRMYNYITGKIDELSSRVQSFDEIIRIINKTVFGDDSTSTSDLQSYTGKILIVIDDFETFYKEEKEKIRNFIRLLNPNFHRIIVTTRANLIVGDEIQVNELSPVAATDFLLKVAENELSGLVNLVQLKQTLLDGQIQDKIHEITNGRPLFIFQFAFLIPQLGDIKSALQFPINQTSDAFEFLYGRIYEYLPKKAQDIFVVMSLLVTEDDLSNLVNKVKYVLNLEHDKDVFDASMSELIKLRIIELKEEDFFSVYSKEILQIMNDYFMKRDDSFKGACKGRLNQISRDNKLDNEQALLLNANATRFSKNEEEAVSSYKHILNRTTSPYIVKLQAILNLASYLYLDRGKREFAISILTEYYHMFKEDGNFIKMLATYNWVGAADSDKEKAISALLSYSLQPYGDQNNNLNIEILGLLLTYRGIYTTRKKDELKELLSYGEINLSEFRSKNDKLKLEFNDIAQHQGNKLLTKLRVKPIQSTSPAARQNSVTGLHQYVEVCVRLGRYDVAMQVCEFVISKYPENVHPLFKSKIAKIKRYQVQK